MPVATGMRPGHARRDDGAGIALQATSGAVRRERVGQWKKKNRITSTTTGTPSSQPTRYLAISVSLIVSTPRRRVSADASCYSKRRAVQRYGLG